MAQWLKGLHHHSFLTEMFEEMGPQNMELFASLIFNNRSMSL